MFDEIYNLIIEKRIGNATDLHKMLVAKNRYDLVDYFIDNSDAIMPYVITMDFFNRGEYYVNFEGNFVSQSIAGKDLNNVLRLGKIAIRAEIENLFELREFVRDDKELNKIMTSQKTLPYVFPFLDAVHKYCFK